MSRILAACCLIAAMAPIPPASAQTSAPRFYMRQKMTGMRMKATVRQLVSHPYWGCLPDQPYGFNADYYAALNEDVVEANYPLYQHYVDHGRSEGRKPCDAAGSTTYNPEDSYTRLIPRSGSRNYTATASQDRYSIPYDMNGAAVTIDGFDVEKDTLGLGWIMPQLGMPQFVDLGGNLGTELRWNGKVLVRMVGISVDEAKRIVEKGRTVTS